MKLLVSITPSRKHQASFGIEHVSCIKIGTKRSNFYTGSWKVFTVRVANWILENPDQVLVLMKEIMTGNPRIVYDQFFSKKTKKKHKKKTKQNNSLTVSLEHASLHETNRGGYTFECNCMLL